MLPTDILREDHDLILMVLHGMKSELKNFDITGKINLDKLEKFLDFTDNFSNGYHHVKEEQRLFKMLEEHGMSKDSDPISRLMGEHLQDKEFIKSILFNIEHAKFGDMTSLNEIKDKLSDFIDMTRNHIYTENNILFNKAERVLDKKEMELLTKEFKEYENKPQNKQIRTKYKKLACEIAGKSM